MGLRYLPLLAICGAPVVMAQTPAIDFQREIRPLLSDNCFQVPWTRRGGAPWRGCTGWIWGNSAHGDRAGQTGRQPFVPTDQRG